MRQGCQMNNQERERDDDDLDLVPVGLPRPFSSHTLVSVLFLGLHRQAAEQGPILRKLFVPNLRKTFIYLFSGLFFLPF